MTAKKTPDKTGAATAYVEMLQAQPLEMTSDALFADLNHYFSRSLGRRTVRRRSPFLYEALVYATRDRLMERWNRTNIEVETTEEQESRRACTSAANPRGRPDGKWQGKLNLDLAKVTAHAHPTQPSNQVNGLSG